ncbi:hypothetical protein AA0114_g7481 [Alternaria tenuissima]|jgi:hypothetical protein|uniref:Uncharacterized protein n=1 Tax=Alternaria tenuissima TaxID=119927 RepID=A0A4Q4ME46_9PLEO|nr:hypothetical protein AA0114_g7481 [Alternaria tenuissima]
MTNRGYLYGINYTLPGPSEPEPVYFRGRDLGSRRNSMLTINDEPLISTREQFDRLVGMMQEDRKRREERDVEMIEQLRKLNQTSMKDTVCRHIGELGGFGGFAVALVAVAWKRG